MLRLTSVSPEEGGVYDVLVQNAVGWISSEAATIVVSDENMPLYLTAGRLIDGLLKLQINGPLGSEYLIEATSDLTADWTPVFQTKPVTLPLEWTDTESSGSARRFYRARLLP